MSAKPNGSGGIEVAIGIVDGQVIAQWHEPTNEIVFDPKNAYLVGLALSRAAMEAHDGASGTKDDIAFVDGQLTSSRITVSDVQRVAFINKVSTILKTFIDQGKSPGYMALHVVDTMLAETAK
jgi:hypothetical protein